MTAIVPVSENQRTTVMIELRQDPWPVIDAWGSESGYGPRPHGSTDHSRIYQKGIGFWVAPMMLAARVDGNILTLQAWVRGTLLARIMSLFILPAEMHIRSGGFKAVIPRNMARGHVNRLISRLGGTPIP